MTIETALAWSISRALLVATLALPLSVLVWQWCTAKSNRNAYRMLFPFLGILPLFVPDLLIGFTYRLTSARLVHSVLATEGFYAGLLLCRIVALQVAIRLILPGSSVSAESLHSWKLQKVPTTHWWTNWIRLQILGPFRTPLVAWLAGCLICFQDFETAALLQIDRHPIAWTVWLFDAHAAGEPLSNSLRHVLRPLFLQGILILPAIIVLGVSQQTSVNTAAARPENRTWQHSNHFGQMFACLIVVCGVLAVVAWPIISHCGPVLDGFRSLLNQHTFLPRMQQIAMSLLTSVLACSLAMSVSVWLCDVRARWLALVFVLPGLCGSLFVSLTLLAFFQLPLINNAYDTWLPLIVGQSLLMMPKAWLLVTLLNVRNEQSSLHSGQLLVAANTAATKSTGQNVLWRLSRRRWLLTLAILSHWCIWDVTVAATLRPVTFEPIVTRLYNEMHYRPTETLVALTVLTFAIPFIAYLLAGFVWKHCPQQRDINA